MTDLKKECEKYSLPKKSTFLLICVTSNALLPTTGIFLYRS